MQDEKVKLFSVIVPAYRQERTIARDVKSIYSALKKLSIPFELIIVIDGEMDGSFKEAQSVNKQEIHVVGYKINKGKGYAVRYGMAQSHGDIIGFMDAGGDLKPEALAIMMDTLVWNDADIVIGSKRHPFSKIHYPWFRRVISFIYQILIRILFSVNVRDTQVGMKLYKRQVLADVLPRLLVKQFAFDIEILAVAYHLGYTRIIESPIELNFEAAKSSITSTSFWRVIFNTLKDTLAVFYRLHIRHYYDDASKRKWRFDPELNFRVNIG